MAGRIETRLEELGLTLPDAPPPAANYVPYVISGRTLYISGQGPMGPDGIMTGKVGDGVSVEDGQKAARLCAVNILAQVKAAVGGDLSKVSRCLRLGGFVNCGADFTDHPTVINGASDLMVDVMGEAGRHARTAVGAPSLPFDIAVEVEAVFELR